MRTVLTFLLLLAVVLACGNEQNPVPTSTTVAQFGHGTEDFSSMDRSQLAQLKDATAPFHNFDKAVQAGYDTQLTVCWFHSELGAQGYHYGKFSLIDGEVSLLEPELLVYEPKRNGGFRLVAVEYIVPIAAWPDASPPSLLGQDFHDNGAGLFILHVWTWLHNPSGLFADWNPKASCEFAAEAEDQAS